MRYIIMADGKGRRWKNYMGLDKHDISIGGETLMERTVRLLHDYDPDAEVIITSHNENVNIHGATRYEPLNNVLEIDRFTRELIADNVCFLYGDVYYTEDALSAAVENRGRYPLLFIGSKSSICAVLVRDSKRFEECYNEVRKSYLEGRIKECKGWQVYHSYASLPLEGREIGEAYLTVDGFTRDFNSPEDYLDFISEHK